MTETKEEGSFIRINVTETVQNMLLFIVPTRCTFMNITLTANFVVEKNMVSTITYIAAAAAAQQSVYFGNGCMHHKEL
jgi:hypothetical protein